MISIWDPRKDNLSLRDAMSHLIEQSFVPASLSPRHGLALDVLENGEAFVVRATLPGADKDKVDVRYEGDTLTIHAEIPAEPSGEGERYLLRERFSGEVHRTVTFPVRVDADKAAADYSNGVLTLTLPKSESVKPRSIKIG